MKMSTVTISCETPCLAVISVFYSKMKPGWRGRGFGYVDSNYSPRC